MKILNVTAKNFRSYSNLDWKLKDTGLVLIDGINTENGRSNMSGKTTLLDSAFWGLFGYLSKWNGPKGGPVDAVIKRGETSCQVTVTFENEGQTYTVERSRPSRLKMTRNGMPVEGKTADLDARIQTALGLSPAQFLLSVYISQDRDSSFFTMGDSERANLLSVIAGLESLNHALEKAKEERKDVDTKLQRLRGSNDILSASLVALPAERDASLARKGSSAQHVETLTAHIEVVRQSAEKRRAAEHERLQEVLENEEVEFFNKIGVMNLEFTKATKERATLNFSLANLPQVDEALQSKLSLVSQQYLEALAHNDEVARLTQKNLKLKEGIERALADAEKVQGGTCGSCGQGLPHWDHNLAMKPYIEQASRLSLQVVDVPEKRDLEALSEEKDTLKQQCFSERARLEQAPNQIKAEMKALEEKCQSLQRESIALEKSCMLLKASIEKDIQALSTQTPPELAVTERELAVAQNAFENAVQDLKRIERHEKDLEQKLLSNGKDISSLNRKLDELADLIDLFGPKGLRTVYFDDIIQRIGARAGQLFSIMTDGAYSTRIDQEGETAKGESRLILKPIITKGGLQVPQDDLSGGARRMAMLAYDIAVSESMTDSNTLFLDEALDGLDAQGKAEAMKLLEEVSKNRSVYIVDHTSEIRAAVQDVIQVQYTKGSSSLANAPY